MIKLSSICLSLLLFLATSEVFAQKNNQAPPRPPAVKPEALQVKAAPEPVSIVLDPVLLRVAGEAVTRSEFDRVYRKNNRDSVFTEAAVRDYLELYINYKLKVKEAEELKMDTSETFKSELAGYRKQLAQPYLTDKEVNESLIREAYERLNKDVRASHILLKLGQDVLPKDTLAAYNRILKLRDMILKGADFAKVARDSSEDPSAKDNSGDLGYFTGMQMVYPFETAAYSTKPGSISMPVRTRFGYHIIKVADVRPAQGELLVSHIMVRTPKEANDSLIKSAEARIREAEKALKSGESWDSVVVKYTEDKGSLKKGGELPWFGTGRMVPEFEKAAFALKNKGDVTGVVKTAYGFHLIRLLDRRGVPSFDEKKGELKQAISRDSRNEASRASMIAKVKKQYRFKEFPGTRDELASLFDSTLAEGDWELTRAENFKKVMFSLTDSNNVVSTFTQQDFAKYVSTHQTKRSGTSPQIIASSMFEQWTGETCLSYYEDRLDLIFPDFRNLMKEYRDGILLFDLTDKMVWSKAVKDTAGLEEFYASNKNNYLWGERCEAAIYNCISAKVAAEFRKQMSKGKKTSSEIIQALNSDKPESISVREARFSKGEDELVDATGWKTGLSGDFEKNNRVYIVDIKSVLPVTPKTLEEAKGVITADYQTYLEKSWIKSLRSKYPIQVNEPVLETIWKK